MRACFEPSALRQCTKASSQTTAQTPETPGASQASIWLLTRQKVLARAGMNDKGRGGSTLPSWLKPNPGLSNNEGEIEKPAGESEAGRVSLRTGSSPGLCKGTGQPSSHQQMWRRSESPLSPVLWRTGWAGILGTSFSHPQSRGGRQLCGPTEERELGRLLSSRRCAPGGVLRGCPPGP